MRFKISGRGVASWLGPIWAAATVIRRGTGDMVPDVMGRDSVVSLGTPLSIKPSRVGNKPSGCVGATPGFTVVAGRLRYSFISI